MISVYLASLTLTSAKLPANYYVLQNSKTREVILRDVSKTEVTESRISSKYIPQGGFYCHNDSPTKVVTIAREVGKPHSVVVIFDFLTRQVKEIPGSRDALAVFPSKDGGFFIGTSDKLSVWNGKIRTFTVWPNSNVKGTSYRFSPHGDLIEIRSEYRQTVLWANLLEVRKGKVLKLPETMYSNLPYFLGSEKVIYGKSLFDASPLTVKATYKLGPDERVCFTSPNSVVTVQGDFDHLTLYSIDARSFKLVKLDDLVAPPSGNFVPYFYDFVYRIDLRMNGCIAANVLIRDGKLRINRFGSSLPNQSEIVAVSPLQIVENH